MKLQQLRILVDGDLAQAGVMEVPKDSSLVVMELQRMELDGFGTFFSISNNRILHFSR